MSKEGVIYDSIWMWWWYVLYTRITQMKEDQIRERLEEITRELVKIQWKKYRTNLIEQNKEYRALCVQQGMLEWEKEKLLSIIKENHARRN